jgi:hypothetical protein
MTSQAPSGWPPPPRAAQHAAPHYPSTPLRQHAGRALRLLAAAGAGVMGLCVVVGAVALVAAATGPPRATHLASEAQRSASQRARNSGAAQRAGPRPAGASRSQAVFAGPGSGRTRPFSIGGNGIWTLEWSYSCQPLGYPGSFVVSEDDAHTSGVSVHETGTAGHGATWAYQDAGTHTLAVRSRFCTWTLRVLRQGPPR